MLKRVLIPIFTVFLLSGLNAQGNTSIFDRMYGREVLKVQLETDMSYLIEDRKSIDYQPAIFTISDTRGKEEVHIIKVRGRGKYRRKVCQFPPIKLNFSKRSLNVNHYNPSYDKLKLVTHCLDDKYEGRENVFKEFMAYKLYNELTANSLRVQLVSITYIDTGGKYGKLKRYGFLIEDTDEMASRIGGVECDDCMNAPANSLSLADENMLAVFQYMIGNEDWSLPLVRNVKLVDHNGGKGIIPVPYDFDFSGMVDASYALPNSDYQLTDVKQRVFIGLKVEEDLLIQTLNHFVEKKQQLLDMVKGDKNMNWASRMEVLEYLESFYAEIEPALSGKGVLSPDFADKALKEGAWRLRKQGAKK
jgi:hypothetical protein